MELILVRHGETDSNIKGTYLGWTDVELNDTGIRQAECAAQKLKAIKIDKVYSSPFKRVKKTAEIINEHHSINIEYVDSLKERNFGVWDNLTYAQITANDRDECDKWNNDWLNYKIKGGESCLELYERLTAFIDKLLLNDNDSTILMVTHLGCIRIIISYLLGMPVEGLWHFRVDNCGIVKFSINEEKYAYITSLNA